MKRLQRVSCAFVLFLLTTGSIVSATDWSLVIKPVNPYLFGSRQIFSPVTIINNGTTILQASLRVEIKTHDGVAIAEYFSAQFELRPGILDMSGAAPAVNSGNFSHAEIRDYDRKNGTLPSGNYRYCAELTSLQTGEKILECSSITLEGLNAAVLINPEKESYYDEGSRPQFNWIPCTPVKPSVFYNFKMVEVMEGQTPREAMQSNPAVHQTGGLTTNSFNYPVNAPRLMDGKQYAWQIECYEDFSAPELEADKNSANKSEIFNFYVGKKLNYDTIVFVTPLRAPTADYSQLNEGRLYFSFKSDYLQGVLDYSIKTTEGKDIPVSIFRLDDEWVKSATPLVMKGENKYVLEFSQGYPPSGIYTMELKDLKGLVYYVKFKVN